MPELCTSYAYNFLGLELGLGLFPFSGLDEGAGSSLQFKFGYG